MLSQRSKSTGGGGSGWLPFICISPSWGTLLVEQGLWRVSEYRGTSVGPLCIFPGAWPFLQVRGKQVSCGGEGGHFLD